MASFKNAMRYSFMVVNGILWLLSLVLLMYLMVRSVGSLTHLNLLFGNTATMIGLFVQGSFVFTVGFVGCFVGTRLNRNVLKVYLTLTSLLILTVIFAIVTLDSRRKQLSNFWMNTKESLRNDYQLQNECCGYSDPSSEYGSLVPISCYNATVIGNATYYTPWTETCSVQLGDNPGKSLLRLLVGIEVSVLLSNVVGIVSGAYVLKKLIKRKEPAPETDRPTALKAKQKQKYRFVKGPINLGKEYSDLEGS